MALSPLTSPLATEELIESKLVEKDEKLNPMPLTTEDQPEPESCVAQGAQVLSEQ
jgi:hypothetical protein